MSLEDKYLGRITPDEAREAHSRAESDCEHMPSAAWRALHAVGQMRYEYAVVCLVEGDVWRYARGGVLITPLEHEATWHPTREEAEAYAERRRSTAKETRVVPRLVSEPEVVA